MRRILTSIPLMVVAVSCMNSFDASTDLYSAAGSRALPLRGSAPGSGTLDLCAFRTDGSLYTHVRQDGDSVVAELPEGEAFTWWLIANAPEVLLEDIASETQLIGTKVLLGHNTRESLVMAGSGRGIVTPDPAHTVRMQRLLCKVSLGYLLPVFLGDEEFENKEIVLNRVFLLNAPTSVYLDGTPISGEKCNVGLLDTGLPEDISDLVLCSPFLRLTEAERYSLNLSLYCCPDPFGNTKLVLELAIGGETDYYPVALPPMGCNTEYRIDGLELLSWGSLSPEIPVNRNALSFSVEVRPWEIEDKSLTLE